MAAARKKQFASERLSRKTKDEPVAYAQFMRALLQGEVRAIALTEGHDKTGRLTLEYEEP